MNALMFLALANRSDSATLCTMNDTNKEIVLFNVDQRGVAVLQVNRPEARNALNWAAQKRFSDLLTDIAMDTKIRVLIVTGTRNSAFVSGGDLKELYHHPERAAGERLNRMMSLALDRMKELPVPVIAAVNGDAFGGGCEIVTACDLRLASSQTRFSFAHVRNGLTTGWGGTGRLVRQVGQIRALELLLTARLFSAEEAKQMGLIHRIVADGENVLEAARDWANELVALPQKAMAATKILLYAAGHLPMTRLSQIEADLFVNLWDTPDHIEALAAFGEKRRPIFNQVRDHEPKSEM